MQILEELAARGGMLCPETRRPLRVQDGRIVSPSGADLGPAHGPVNLLRGFSDSLGEGDVPREFVERVRAHLELPESADPEIAGAIAATGARFRASHLSAEARVLAERFGMPAFEFGGSEPAPRLEPGTPRLVHVRDYIGERLTAGREVLRSVRLRNDGSGNAPAGTRIEARWFDAEGAAMPAAETCGELPVAMEPGREMTVIAPLRAPSRPGRYELRLRAGGEDLATLAVQAIACELPVFEYRYFHQVLEYGPDHHAAALDLLEFLAARYPGRPVTALEIGGGVTPTAHSIAAHGHRLVSTDISHAQSILGELFVRHRTPYLADSLAFVSCDGADLPFADGAFDGVTLFAAFHHFEDPHAVLEEARRVTRPDGFVYLGCENCVPNPADPQYREELRRGINEQMWTLAEMSGILARAGLRVERARVDYHSLKAALVRA